MKGFAMDETGDVLIENNEISIVVGESLLQQNVRDVLRTNLREWFFDWAQGVDFNNLLGKNTNAELVRYEIDRGLRQVDESFTITEFDYKVDKANRRAIATFKAQNADGETVGGDFSWD